MSQQALLARGVLLNLVTKLTVMKQPAGGPPPVLILTDPAVSVPLTLAVAAAA